MRARSIWLDVVAASSRLRCSRVCHGTSRSRCEDRHAKVAAAAAVDLYRSMMKSSCEQNTRGEAECLRDVMIYSPGFRSFRNI